MDTPQFQKAEYASFQGSDVCKTCGQSAGNTYYRVNGGMACASCAEKARLQIPVDQHSAFVRGIVFGIGGAIIGLIAYSTFAIVTGVVIGFAALAVGYIVAKAMMFGSRGMGGRRYQIAAALLTYFAVSMSVIPISISQYLKAHPNATQNRAQTTAQAGGDVSARTSGTADKQLSVGAVLASLLFVGIAAPLLELRDPVHGAIGLIILYVGIQIAWKMTRGTSATEIVGPFNNTVPAPVAPPALG